METVFYLSKFQSGDNSVEFVTKGDTYSIVSNGVPVFSSESLPDSLSRYYREISAINSAQESGKDLTMHLFGDEVVKVNRYIIPKLAMLGKSLEVKYMKALNSRLEEAMDTFFKDSVDQKIKSINIFKYEPQSALASTPSVNGDELTNAGAGETVTPRRLELKTGKKVDENTVELKSTEGFPPFPEEDKWNEPVEPATKVKATMQMKTHPRKQEPITGEEIEPTYIKRSRVDKDEAFELGRDLGVDFDKIPFEEWMEGLKIEHEHEDVTGDDHYAIGKIAHAHLKERPDYYKKLEEYVEKSLRKDFTKMEEGDQAHENVGFENKNTTGKTQEPISGEEEKLEKEAFSMDAPKVKNMETQEPIVHKAESNPSETNGHGEEYSKREADYVGELGNQTSRPKKIVLKRSPINMVQNEGGGDVRENKEPCFQYSLTEDQLNKIWNIILEK
jgi:hypothetical protein